MTIKFDGPAAVAESAAALPSHLMHCRTLREALTYSCTLRMLPKKVTLRALAEHASDLSDKAQLLWWSSNQGAPDYTNLMTQQLYFIDILRRCPSCRSVSTTQFLRNQSYVANTLLSSPPLTSSCRPPIALLLDAMLPLVPRSYSACSAATAHPGQVYFAFNVVDNVLNDDKRQA